DGGRERVRCGRSPRGEADERALGDRLASPEGLTARSNTFDERAVLQEVAAAAGQGALVGDVRAQAQRFAGRRAILRTSRGEMTTTELVACERSLIGAAIARAGEGTAVVDSSLVERALVATGRVLTAEQAAVVRSTVSSGDGVTVIHALAGTGKTYTAG